MPSFTATDIYDLNNAESESKRSRNYGSKTGSARAVFSATGGVATGTHGLGLTIPKGSFVRKAFYKVLTTFTSSTDVATIALQVAGANDLVSAIAISNGGNPWDAGGAVATVPTDSLANEVDVTTASEVSAVVAVEDLTAGKLLVWVEWEYYGDVALT